MAHPSFSSGSYTNRRSRICNRTLRAAIDLRLALLRCELVRRASEQPQDHDGENGPEENPHARQLTCNDPTMTADPRLFVIMAADAPIAIVIRRGPAAWAQLTLWRTDDDTFTEGAWFRGRIYAEKCDLSPDGKLFVYSAFKGSRLGTSTTQSWTAVSRPPWLQALALWPMGTTYGGGGRFDGERRLIVRGGASVADRPPPGLEIVAGAADVHRSTNEVEGAEWSGRDQRNRLVFAARGCLFARAGVDDRLLADFRAQRPRTEPAPEWAMEPLAVRAPSRKKRRT
jgi:hypothetical protein